MTHQRFGVCYYPEHWPETRWETDANMMVDAGITYVRIGEFAWSRLEPSRGDYRLDWLERAIDILHARGLKVVLGTPTATPPKWLFDEMPDMAPVDAEGRPRGFGSRRHYCFSHEPYQLECDRIVAVLADRFGQHPGVAAWQTDNEYGCHDTVESYSKAARTAFRTWLCAKYETIDALNLAWGNVFWSMEYRSFEEVDLPNLAVTELNPAHRLDFQRFSSDQVAGFNKRQVQIIREKSPGRDVLHNFMGAFTAFDHYKVSDDLDAASWDAYPIGFLERDTNDEARKLRYMRIGDPDIQAFHHDLYRACGRGRWWIMEQQPGPVNWAPYNPAPIPGAERLWALEAFAAGAEVVSWFRWRQPTFAQEQYHEALLLPDGTPNVAYRVCQDLAAELEAVDAEVATRRADVALVFDYESEWAWKILPQGQSFSYLDLVMTYYRALRLAGLSVDVVPPNAAAVSDRKLVVMPGLMAPTDEMIDAILVSGARVIAGPRTDAKTADFQTVHGGTESAFKKLFDINIWRVESLRPGAEVPLLEAGFFTRWREFIRYGETVRSLLESKDGHPAILVNEHGAYIGGWLDENGLAGVIRDEIAKAGLPVADLHEDIRIRDNGPLRHVFNYGPETVDVKAQFEGFDIVSGGSKLGPAGVAIGRLKK